jgi:hypothetical protein
MIADGAARLAREECVKLQLANMVIIPESTPMKAIPVRSRLGRVANG